MGGNVALRRCELCTSGLHKIPQHRAGEEMPASYSGGHMGASLRCVETAMGINIPQPWAL